MMAKYDKWSRWFIAKCYQRGISYPEFAPMAKKVLGLDVPQSTYDMQKGYLKKRTPEQMGDEDVISLGELAKEA